MQVYSFLNLAVLINGQALIDWPEDDDSIQAKRLTDSASHKTGADGKMLLVISADRSGEFTFKLQQTSPSNAYLMGLLAQMENGAETFVPVNVRCQDTFRNDVATGTVGYIKKPADFVRGMGTTPQEWVIVVENMDLVFGDVQPALVS